MNRSTRRAARAGQQLIVALRRRYRLALVVALTLPSLVTLVACNDDSSGTGPTPPPGSAIMTLYFDAGQDTMDVLLTDSATIAQAEQRVLTGVGSRMPTGLIVRGAGVDARYPFHYLPDSVRLTDLAMEVCDGRPMKTPQEVNAFFYLSTGDSLRATATWCPWGAEPVAVVRH